MSALKYFIVLLFIVKLFSGSYLKQLQSSEDNIQEFVEFEFDKLKYSVLAMKPRIRKKARFRRAASLAADKLIIELDSLTNHSCENIKEWQVVFNRPSLHTLIETPPVNFTYNYNNGLSFEKNKYLLLEAGYTYILKEFLSLEKTEDVPEPIVPIVMILKKTNNDSLELKIEFVFNVHNVFFDNIGMYCVYNDTVTIIESIPFNIGQVEGEIKICIEDYRMCEQKCYLKTF